MVDSIAIDDRQPIASDVNEMLRQDGFRRKDESEMIVSIKAALSNSLLVDMFRYRFITKREERCET